MKGPVKFKSTAAPWRSVAWLGFVTWKMMKMGFNLVISVARDNWQMNNGAESYYNIIDSEKMEPALSF